MVYDRQTLAELLRRADNKACDADCGRHPDHLDRLAAHALDELESDSSDYVDDQIREYAAGEDL